MDRMGNEAELQKTTGALTLLFSGNFTRERRGAIFPPTMANAKLHISTLAAGAARKSGKNCLKYLLIILIMNGSYIDTSRYTFSDAQVCNLLCFCSMQSLSGQM